MGSVTAALAAVTEELRPVARALYREVTVSSVTDGVVHLALANASLMDKAEAVRPDVQERLARAVGHAITVTFGAGTPARPTAAPTAPVDVTAPPAPVDEADEHAGIVIADLPDADVSTSGVDKLSRAFPGATIVSDEP